MMATENRKFIQNQKKDLENEILNLKQTIIKMEEDKRETICKLKTIMLKTDNHENNSLNKALKKEMIEEYTKEFNKLDKIRKEEKLSYEDNKKKLDEKKKAFYELEKKKIFLKKKEEFEEDIKIEEKRENILKDTIYFLKNNGMVEEGINQLNSIILKKKNELIKY